MNIEERLNSLLFKNISFSKEARPMSKELYDELLDFVQNERKLWEREFLNQPANQHDQAVRKILIEEIKARVGFLRQWLNEEKIDDPKKMVSSEDIEYWLKIKKAS